MPHTSPGELRDAATRSAELDLPVQPLFDVQPLLHAAVFPSVG